MTDSGKRRSALEPEPLGKVSDRLVFMHAGRIHEMGLLEVIFGSPQTPELKQFLSSSDV